jgi:hypothetical protein
MDKKITAANMNILKVQKYMFFSKYHEFVTISEVYITVYETKLHDYS